MSAPDSTWFVEPCIWEPTHGAADTLSDGTWRTLTSDAAERLQQAGADVEWAVYERKTPGSRRDVEWRCGCVTRADAERIAAALEATATLDHVRAEGGRQLEHLTAELQAAVTAKLHLEAELQAITEAARGVADAFEVTKMDVEAGDIDMDQLKALDALDLALARTLARGR